MQIALDHIVHTVRDLEAAAAELDAIGVRTVAGGRHPQWGTRNALCHFGLTYVELIAIEDRAVAQGSTFGRSVLAEQSRGDGLWRLALRTDDIEAASEKVRAAGYRCAGPVPGRRQRPDGSTLRWSLAFPDTPDRDLVPPMLIDWHEPDRRRIADLVALGVADAQPPAVIHAVCIACTDPVACAEWMRHAFGLTAAAVATCYGPGLRLPLRGGDVLFVGGDEASPAVHEALRLRGERPFAVHLAAGGGGAGGEVRIGGALYTFAPLLNAS